MNQNLNFLLRSGLAATIQEREVFIEKLANVLEEKMGTDPEKSAEIGERIIAGLENLKTELLFEQIAGKTADAFGKKSPNEKTENSEDINHRLDQIEQKLDLLHQKLDRLIQK